MLRSRSEIWNFFVLNDEKSHVNCKLCQAKLKYVGGTSAMHNHLKHVHKRGVDSKSPAQMKVQVNKYYCNLFVCTFHQFGEDL